MLVCYKRYVDAFNESFGENVNMPTETTCCWCLLEDDEEYCRCQFFINVTAGIAMNILSGLFCNGIEQLGTTFLDP